MKIRPHLFSLSKNSDSLFAAVLGFFLIQMFCKHSGIGISPDSVTYLSSSRHLLVSQEFRSFDNLPTSDFPIAYPFFLAVISFITELDPLQFGCFLNGILFGLFLFTLGTVLNGFKNSSGWYKRIILTCALLSPALQEVYSMLWSETLFLLLILFFLIALSRYLRQPGYLSLIFSAALCSLVCLTRYAGIFLIITGIALVLFNVGIEFRKRMAHAFVFGTISVSLLFFNIFRNLRMTGLAMGIRPKGDSGVLKILQNFGDVLCDWLLLNRTPGRSVFLSFLVIIIFSVTVLRWFWTKKDYSSFEYLLAVTGLFYSLFMICSSVLTRYELFTNRLLSPMYIPVICSMSWWIPDFIRKKTFRIKWITGVPILLLCAWFLNIQLAADYEYYDGVKDAGVPGYQEDPFVKTEIVGFLKNNKNLFDTRYPIYSNAGDAFYFVTGLPAFQLPFIDFQDKVRNYYAGSIQAGKEYLVWFENEDNPQMPDLASILKNKKMILLKHLKDGSIFVTGKPSF